VFIAYIKQPSLEDLDRISRSFDKAGLESYSHFPYRSGNASSDGCSLSSFEVDRIAVMLWFAAD